MTNSKEESPPQKEGSSGEKKPQKDKETTPDQQQPKQEKPPEPTASTNPHRPIDSQIKQLNKDFSLWEKQYENFINNLRNKLMDALRPQIEREVKNTLPGTENQDQVNQEVKTRLAEAVELELYKIKKIFNISDIQNPHERNQIITEVKQQVTQLLSKGIIEQEEAKQALEIIDKYIYLLEQYQNINIQGNSLIERMTRFIQISDEKHLKLLAGLETADSLKQLLLTNYKTTDGKIDFFRFYLDVKEFLVEEILSSVDAQPNLFFQEAFNNPFTYQGAYLALLDHLRKVSAILSQDVEFGQMRGVFYEVEIESGFNQQLTSQNMTPYVKQTEKDMRFLLNFVLNNRLPKVKNIFEILHNAEKIVDEGLGFKTLAEHAHRIDVSDFDWFLLEDQELAKVYVYYIQNLRLEVYSNNHVLTPKFGLKDSQGLDKAQERALIQIISSIPPDKQIKILPKLRRLLRLAGGISKTYTCDYWLILMNAYLPMEKETDKTTGKTRFKPVFKGVGEKGPETMLASLVQEALWIRFNLPHYYPVLPYVYQPADFDKFGPLDHKLFYIMKERREDAFWSGADDNYLQWAKNNLRLGDFLKVKMMSAWLRRGWRISDIVSGYTEMKNSHYNFYKTIANLWTAGPLFVKEFIDNINYEKLPPEVLNEVTKTLGLGENIKPAQLSSDQKDIIKEFLYRRFLFTPYFALFPTKPLIFERRELTPKGEPLIREKILELLKDKLKNLREKFTGTDEEFNHFVKEDLVSIFINALEMLSREKFLQNQADFITIASSITSFDDFNNRLIERFRFTDRDFNEETLKVFLESSKRILGTKRESILQNLDVETFKTILSEILVLFKEQLHSKRNEIDSSGEKKANVDLYNRFIFWAIKKDLYFSEFSEGVDLSRIFFQGGGVRMVERFIGDTFTVVEKFNENVNKLFVEGAIALVKANVNQMDQKQFEEFVNNNILPPLKDAVERLKNIDSSVAYEFAARAIDFFHRVVAMDDRYRVLFIGDILAFSDRLSKEWQANIVQDAFPTYLDRPTQSLNRDKGEVLIRLLANGVQLPWDEKNYAKAGYTLIDKTKVVANLYEYQEVEKTIGLGPFKKTIKVKVPVMETYDLSLFGGKIKIKGLKRPKLKESAINKWHMGKIKKVAGHTLDFKILDRILPAATLIALMVLIYLGWAAYKKNTDQK